MSAALYTAAYLLMNIAQQTMWFFAYSRIFPPKLPPRWYYPAVVLLNTCITVLALFPLASHTELRITVGGVLVLGGMLLLHSGKLLRKLLTMVAFYITMALTEMTMFFLAPNLSLYAQHHDFCHPELIAFYCTFLLTQAFYAFLLVYGIRLLTRKSGGDVPDRDRLYYVLFPINQFVLLSIWFYHYVFTAPAESFTTWKLLGVAAIAVFCVLTDVLLFRLIGRTAENARLRARNELMEEQIATKAKYARLTAQTYSSMRQMRHDIANHICTIHAMLQNGEKDAAQRYVSELEKTSTIRSLLSDCQNTAVDAFLQERSADLAAQGVSLSLDIHLPAYCFVSDVDLITALGNLLDNAAEACRQVAEPYIRLRAGLADGFLHIETENPYDAKTEKKERRISYMERGSGIRILRSLAEKYGGSFASHADGAIYNTTLVLKEPGHGQHLPL